MTTTHDDTSIMPANATGDRPTNHRRRWSWILLVGAATGALTWFVWSWLGSAPDAVDLGAALDGVDTSSSAGDGAASADGTWTVDTTVGEFSVTDTTGTFVGFRIDEELNDVGATEAIGRTPDVSGSITIDGSALTEATITADLTSVVSDRSQRDDNIQDALDTTTDPDATFVLSETIDLGSEPGVGDEFSVEAVGELTISGVTRPVVVGLEAAWTGDVVVVTGTVDVSLADYDVEAPSAPMVVSVADTATVELQLYLTR